jgi:hypothetical protein
LGDCINGILFFTIYNICILNFTKIRWKITELLASKVLAETPCICFQFFTIFSQLLCWFSSFLPNLYYNTRHLRVISKFFFNFSFLLYFLCPLCIHSFFHSQQLLSLFFSDTCLLHFLPLFPFSFKKLYHTLHSAYTSCRTFFW